MRKLLLGLVATAALATPLAAATAANAATTDANGVVTVAKAEVMVPLGLNEAAFQKVAMADGPSLTGSNVFTATTTTSVGCSDGTVQEHFRNTILTSPVATTEIYNASANKVTGWTLGAKGAPVITENNSYGTSPTGRFPDFNTICAGHGYVDFHVYNVAQSHSDVTSFTFDGKVVNIQVQPYVAPAPAV